MAIDLRPFDAAEYLDDEESQTILLNDAIDTADAATPTFPDTRCRPSPDCRAEARQPMIVEPSRRHARARPEARWTR